MSKTGRNDPCPCGSRKKFKKCCLENEVEHPRWTAYNINDVPPQVHEMALKMRRKTLADSFAGPGSMKVQFAGQTLRAIGNRIHYTPEGRTYINFLYALLLHALGKKWYDKQRGLDPTKQHVLMRWIDAAQKSLVDQYPKDAEPNAVVPVKLNGYAREVYKLADDIYKLQLKRVLPSKLMDRLRSAEEFQGARYEICVASIFVCCGFDIEWVDNKDRHCEFYGIHPHTRAKIAVEAKSKRRSGTYNTKGFLDPSPRADIAGLYRDALQQNPGDRPFAIFIDVNLPPEPNVEPLRKRWSKEVLSAMESFESSLEKPDPVSVLVFTNYSWHYAGEAEPPSGEHLFAFPLYPKFAFGDHATREAFISALSAYNVISEDALQKISEQTIQNLLNEGR